MKVWQFVDTGRTSPPNSRRKAGDTLRYRGGGVYKTARTPKTDTQEELLVF